MNMFWNKIFDNKISNELQEDKSRSYRYNQYHKKNGDEDMFICQKYLSNPDFTNDDPYQAKIIAIFRNIKPRQGFDNLNFAENPVILYDKKEVERYRSVLTKRKFD